MAVVSFNTACKELKIAFNEATMAGTSETTLIIAVLLLFHVGQVVQKRRSALWLARHNGFQSGGTVTERAYFSFSLNILGRSKKHSLKSLFHLLRILLFPSRNLRTLTIKRCFFPVSLSCNLETRLDLENSLKQGKRPPTCR